MECDLLFPPYFAAGRAIVVRFLHQGACESHQDHLRNGVGDHAGRWVVQDAGETM